MSAPILKRLTSVNDEEVDLVFFCPGCADMHSYRIQSDIGRPTWIWNGSTEKPTFNPSLLVNKSMPEARCHLFVRDGTIQYCGDCHHSLKGKTVPMEPLPEDWR